MRSNAFGWQLGLVASLLACPACNAYDRADLREPSAVRDPRGGASGRVAGSGGNGGDSNSGNGGSAAVNSGGDGGQSASSGAGRDAAMSGNGGDDGDVQTTTCGDGRVSGDELCDVAITSERAGACPSECEAVDECVLRELRGEGCDAECQMVAAECNDGDGCCPADCTSETDDDCSSRCGDGVVQESEGETCEPDSSDAQCPTEADCDDDDPCTTDVLSGSEANCSAACSHAEITALDADDACCPSGGNANTDTDCEPECGNEIAEPGEECDGSMGCDEDCLLTATPEQRDCLDRLTSADGDDLECERCACLSCTDQVFACRDDSNAERRDRCIALVDCALAADCTGTPCYCGDDTTCAEPSDPCVPETEAAAESSNSLVIYGRNTDTAYALGRANALGDCAVMQCAALCP